ncbi:MAG: di-trans,poly-cis-decaprenylcistransferase [Candidatus Nomurabacteria bacterium]|jgi:undecaprenyl diphosphate synthase|nr:di-trans,poly-cis-decaprenylcistransferase [Candidatus Nomurabacteria bacterium]
MNEKNHLNIPNHIGYIVDGNRRWAKSRNLPTFEGHRRGLDVAVDITEDTIKKGVKFVTLYLFSTENWQRAKDEVDFLMGLFSKLCGKLTKRLHKQNIRIVFLGSRTGQVKKSLLSLIDKAEALTRDNTGGTLSICFNYGGQLEIVEACQKIINSGVDAAELTVENFTNYLYYPNVPPVDLLIRTSGEMRISNFMLWRAAYSELLFLDKNWPDMTAQDIDFCIDEFSHRTRRFGGN